jgi:prepilin-type N-terminal cleavage/methylation domain-containing protein
MEVLSFGPGRLRPGAARGQRGVTLIETLAALVILAMVAIAIISLFTHGMQLNAAGADYTAVTNVAKTRAEALLATDYLHADLTQGSHTETLADPPLEVTWTVGEHHLRQGAVTPDQAFGADPLTSTVAANTGNLKVIAVTVASTSQMGIGERNTTVQVIKLRGA